MKISVAISFLFCTLLASAVEAQEHEIDLGIRVQLRDSLSVLEAGDIENQVQLRRARISLDGHVFDPGNEFKIQLGLSPSDLGLRDGVITRTPLLDYYLDFTHLRNVSVMIGQYKVPFSRERIMSSGDLALVDRSLSARTLDITRDIGLTLHSQDLFDQRLMRYYLGIYSGLGRDGFLSQEISEANPLFIARFELHPFGLFNSYDQLDFSRSDNARAAFGFGYAVTGQTHRVTLDGVLHIEGVSFEAASIARINQETQEVDFGYYLQLGLLIPETEHFGLAVRYGQLSPLEGGAVEERREFGGSISYYFEEHKMKLQLDVINYWQQDFTISDQQIRLQLQVGI